MTFTQMLTRLLPLLLSALLLSACTSPSLRSPANSPTAKIEDAILFNYLVGTWQPADPRSDEFGQTTFFADGTWQFNGFENEAAFKRQEPPKLTASGTFKIEGDISIETALKMNPPFRHLPHTLSFRISEIRPDSHTSTELGDARGSRYVRLKSPIVAATPNSAPYPPTPQNETIAEPTEMPTPFHPSSDSISTQLLTLATKTKFKPNEIALLEEHSRVASPSGILAATILYLTDKTKYHDIFRTRCAYDYNVKRIVMPRDELNLMIQDLMAKLQATTALEKSCHMFHFFRSTAFIYLRDDGTEYLAEKKYSAAMFTRVALARGVKEGDLMKFVLDLGLETYRP